MVTKLELKIDESIKTYKERLHKFREKVKIFIDEDDAEIMNESCLIIEEVIKRFEVLKETLSSTKQATIVDTKERLPQPHNIDLPLAKYYHICTAKYGVTTAMYLKDEKGECAWWTSYATKLMDEVVYWIE